MKKMLFAVLCLCAFVPMCLSAAQWTMTITGSTRCIPRKDIAREKTVAPWEAGEVSAGDYVISSAARYYMATSSGTASVEPAHRSGHVTGADGIGWIVVTDTFGEKGVIACVMTDTAAHYNLNAAASTNAPWMVKQIYDPQRGAWYFTPMGGGTAVISFLEL